MTGAYGLPGAFALIFLVSTLTFIPWALIGYIAADKGASSVSLLRPAFGLRGSKLPSVFYLFFGYGWAAVNVFIAAISMSFVFNLPLGWPDAFHTPAGSPINYYLVPSILLICFLQGLFATAGHRAIRYLNWASTVALVGLGAYASYIVLKDFDFGQLWAWRPTQLLSFTFTAGALGNGFTYTLTLPLLLDLLIAYNWTWEFIGDFSRFARSKRAGTWGPFAGASLAQYWFFSVGALMTVAFLVTASPGSVNFAAISDPSFKATQLGFGLGAYLIILFATISTNAGNIYASALGITNIATRWKTSMRRLLLVSSAIVVPLALLPLFETNFVFTYIFFLDFLGAIVVPLWTLTLVDYFLVKARRYTDDLFASEGGHYWYRGGWNWPAVVTLLGGTALYWPIAFGFPALREATSAALPTIAFVRDADGNVYVDLGGGIGVQTVGHRPRSVIRAAKAQLDRLTHISFMVATYGPVLDLAERMADIAPPGLTKSIFLNSGSEAIENAVKVARAATKKAWLVSFKTAFHGRTLLDISLTGKEKPYREGFGPLVREVLLADYAYPYRDPEGRAPADVAKARVEELERLINVPEAAGRVAAILAEPVQGEGGMIVPPKEFFPLLRRLCDQYGIVLIDDEVQAGAGRTGKMWAIENWGTVPDVLVSGKAIGGGLPFGGVTGKPAVMDAPGPGSLGGTFGGNPVVCAAALEAVDEIEKALPGTKRLEVRIRKRLDEMAEGHDRIGEARGIGAMRAPEFVKDPRTKEPDVDLARAVQTAGLKNGLILLTAGFYNNCIRLLPPINIPIPLMAKALDLLEDSLELALAGKAS